MSTPKSTVQSQVPDAGTPIFNQQGYIDPVWHQFFYMLLRRTGGTEGVDAGSEAGRLDRAEERIDDAEREQEAMVPVYRTAQPAPQDVAQPRFSVRQEDLNRVPSHGLQSDPSLHDLASTTANGFMSAGDKSKLDGISPGAQPNVGTDLGIGTRTATAVPLTSSTGNSANFPAASTTLAGALSASDKSKLDGIASGATAVQILGNVSQSGGNPTGAVYESGSNANGFYVKFADGTMICRGSLTGLDQTTTTQAYATTLTFSKAFIDTNISINVNLTTVNVSNVFQGYCRGVAINSSTFSLVQYWSVVQTYGYSYTAIGRWF